MKSLSIRTKIIILNAAVLLVLLIVFLINVNKNMFENYRRVGKDFNLATEQLFRIALADHMLTPVDKNLNNILKILCENRKLEKVRIVDDKGIIKHSLDESEMNHKLSEYYKNLVGLKIDTLHNRLRWIVDETRKSYLSPIKSQSGCAECHGEKEVIAYLNTQMNYEENLNEIQSTFNKIFVLSIIVFVLIAIALVVSFNQLISKRLKKFNKGLNEVKEGNLNFEFNSDLNDEIGEIEKQFNSMVKELKNSKERNEELYFEKLKNIDKLINIGGLTSELAHEINNYSAILKSRLEYLLGESEEREELKEYKEDINAMIRQVESMTEVTKNILKHSKNRKSEKTKVSVKDIVSDVVKLFENNLRKKKINLDYKNLPDVDLIADKFQLEQVLINLITNSIEAIENNGNIEISGKMNNGNFELIFKDDGPGIAANNVENIFMPFFTTKGDEHGSGLGLYIVKRILKKNDATIECVPNDNGAEFKINFRIS